MHNSYIFQTVFEKDNIPLDAMQDPILITQQAISFADTTFYGYGVAD